MKHLAIFGAIILLLISFGKVFATGSGTIVEPDPVFAVHPSFAESPDVKISCPNLPAYEVEIDYGFSGFEDGKYYYDGLKVTNEKKTDLTEKCLVTKPSTGGWGWSGNILCNFNNGDVSIDDTLTFVLSYWKMSTNYTYEAEAIINLSDYNNDCKSKDPSAMEAVFEAIKEKGASIKEKDVIVHSLIDAHKIIFTFPATDTAQAEPAAVAAEEQPSATDSQPAEYTEPQIDEAEAPKTVKEPYFVEVPFPGNSSDEKKEKDNKIPDNIVAPSEGDGCSVAQTVTPSSVLNAILMLLPAVGSWLVRRKK